MTLRNPRWHRGSLDCPRAAVDTRVGRCPRAAWLRGPEGTGANQPESVAGRPRRSPSGAAMQARRPGLRWGPHPQGPRCRDAVPQVQGRGHMGVLQGPHRAAGPSARLGGQRGPRGPEVQASPPPPKPEVVLDTSPKGHPLGGPGQGPNCWPLHPLHPNPLLVLGAWLSWGGGRSRSWDRLLAASAFSAFIVLSDSMACTLQIPIY